MLQGEHSPLGAHSPLGTILGQAPLKAKWAEGLPAKWAVLAASSKVPARPCEFCVPTGAPAVPARRGALVRRSAALQLGEGGGLQGSRGGGRPHAP